LQIETKRLRAADLMIGDAETFHIQGWLDSIASSSMQALSKSVRKQAKFLLSGAFRLALQRGYRATEKGHPVTYASLPARTIPQQPTHAYTSDEVRTSVLEEPARTLVLLAETGLRVSEL